MKSDYSLVKYQHWWVTEQLNWIWDLFKKILIHSMQLLISHTPFKMNTGRKKIKKSHTLAARAGSSVDLMKGHSVNRREGGCWGLDWAYSQPQLRERTWERSRLTELLCPSFQAWKAHLMGREGCKQNSRRTVVSQRTQPAQGKAFMHPLLTPTSPTLAVTAIKSCTGF